MFESIKMKLMCTVTAASVAVGSFAMPVNVWADDDDNDEFLTDLVDMTDDESEALRRMTDHDRDGDIDEDDVETFTTLMTIAALAEAEEESQRQAELERQRQATELAQRQAAEAQKLAAEAQQRALEAQRKAEEERRNGRVSGVWVSTTEVMLTPGQTYQLIAGVKPDSAKNKGVSFSSSNASVATVDGSGIIRGNSVGSCVITARTNEGGYQAFTCVRVNPSPAVAAQTVAQDANWTAIAANMIMAAAPNQVVNLIAPKAMSFDAGMINALAVRKDVGLLIAYPYNGHAYLMAVPAGYNLAARKDASGKVSFLSLAGVKDGKIIVTMTQ